MSVGRLGRALGGLAVIGAALVVARCRDEAPTAPPVTSLTCTLSAAIDGDSIRCADGREIRLLSIDAPEIAQSPWGGLARAELLGVVPIRTSLGVEYDVERKDRFGRDLAYLYLPDGAMLNEHMVASGYAVAFVIAPNRRYEAPIRGAEAAARQTRAGLWADWGFRCRPAAFRRDAC